MASTINITRTLRVENESGITGSEAETVNGADVFGQVVTAGTEELTAMGAHKDHQIQAMALLSDVDATAQFLGTSFNIVSTTAAAVFPGVLHATGDLTDDIFPGDLIRLDGTVADDGIYLVLTVAFGADTTITLENGSEFPGAGGAAVGTVRRVCSQQRMGYAYGVLAIVQAAGSITYTGDVTDKFEAGDFLVLTGTAANDGYWEIDTVTEAAGVTTLICNGGALVANAGAVGQFQLVRTAIALTATEPFLWSIESGEPNPFIHPDTVSGIGPLHNADRGEVASCLVTVPGASNGNFTARICTDPII